MSSTKVGEMDDVVNLSPLSRFRVWAVTFLRRAFVCELGSDEDELIEVRSTPRRWRRGRC